MNENNISIREKHFPTLSGMDWGLVTAVLSLLIILLPGIITRLASLSSTTPSNTAAGDFLVSPAFQSGSLLIAFVLAIYSMVVSKQGSSSRMIALLVLIVCIIRFILPS